MKNKRILYVSSQISPYVENTRINDSTLYLPKMMQENLSEVRVFMPRYGSINERRFQLHEVIRLSGLNINVCDIDQPLIIKVASVPRERLQVYFLDNDDYFKNRDLEDEKTGFAYSDNDERALFFAKGVLETVKKLNWSPDIIHINGYISYLVPMYARTFYKNDPTFADSKIITNIYNDNFKTENPAQAGSFAKKLAYDKIDKEEVFDEYTFDQLQKSAVKHSDAVVIKGSNYNAEVEQIIKDKNILVMDKSNEEEPNVEDYKEFYGKILGY